MGLGGGVAGGEDGWNEIVDPENREESPNKDRRRHFTKPTHIIIHITGEPHFETAKATFLSASRKASPHYLINKDGTIQQLVKDNERAWHAGIPGYLRKIYDLPGTEWKKYLRYFGWAVQHHYPAGSRYLTSDRAETSVESRKALVMTADGSEWDYFSYWARHGGLTKPINYENSKDPNDYSIGIELASYGSKRKSDYEEGLYTGLAKLINNLVAKYDIPIDRKHIVGHEDVNPCERWGWDPNSGFDWDKLFSMLDKFSFVFPVDIGRGREVNEETISDFYYHTEQQYPGGFFPLGANTLWHSGLHLYVPRGTSVVAMADGEIVAAKLADTKEKASGEFGSHNFILLKHKISGKVLNGQFRSQDETDAGAATHIVSPGETLEDMAQSWGTTVQAIRDANPNLEKHLGQNDAGTEHWYYKNDKVIQPKTEAAPAAQEQSGGSDKFDDEEEKTFYSLYMHLNHDSLDPQRNKKLEKIAWLPRVTTEKIIPYNESHELKSGETLQKLARKWKTTPREIRDANPDLAAHYNQNSSGSASSFYAGDIVKRPPGRVTEQHLDPDFLERLRKGGVVKVENTHVTAGQRLWTSGYYGTPAVSMDYGSGYLNFSSPFAPSLVIHKDLIHWEVFSEENLLPSFEPIEDDDNDCNMDTKAIFDMVDQLYERFPGDRAILDEFEVNEFYRTNPKAADLRKYACKFAGEWAMGQEAIDNMKGINTEGLMGKLDPYLWWYKALGESVDMPEDNHVWHYNPIAFIQTLIR